MLPGYEAIVCRPMLGLPSLSRHGGGRNEKENQKQTMKARGGRTRVATRSQGRTREK
jgi:hypothetical protein